LLNRIFPEGFGSGEETEKKKGTTGERGKIVPVNEVNTAKSYRRFTTKYPSKPPPQKKGWFAIY